MLSNLAPTQVPNYYISQVSLFIVKDRPTLQASLAIMQSITSNETINDYTDESTIIEALLVAPPFNSTFTNNYIDAVYWSKGQFKLSIHN